ncbi:hypothetical protein FF38_07484 [Lucilia cuprina]|uniref:Uncharacterized protein n=1 Tax=Lucilia cuprina TaxID=7375 RepID=A0A0L0CP73_LUCCU|nr:hypothetical protein FF38_07484 [Lucilia cuprina]
MALVNCEKFSAQDLILFIESMEQITRMESLKRQRIQRNRAKYLADTLRYLDQQYPAYSSATLSSTDRPEEESVLESFEQKHIAYNSTRLVQQNQYEVINHQVNAKCELEDSLSCHTTIYSLPYECVASTKLEEFDYETLDLKPKEKMEPHVYDEPTQMVKNDKVKSKCSLFNLVRKKYRKCFAKKSNNWRKSESWTRLTVV